MRFASKLTSERYRPLLLLAGIIAVVGFYKAEMSTYFFTPLPDGGYYTNVAAHVRDGDGLVSDISVLNEGCPYLPHPTGIYPLWPLVLGYSARLFPLFELTRWLPAILYFGILLLAYVWGASLFPKELFPKAVPGFNGGHVLVLMLGLDSELFRYTSSPYTEGLAWFIAFAALVRFRKIMARPTWYGGLELGVWLGLAYLSRYQHILMTFAAVVAMVWAIVFVGGKRRAYAIEAAAAAVAFGTIFGLQYRRLAGFVINLDLPMMIRWDQLRYSDVLTPIPTVYAIPGFFAYLADRAKGFEVAFGTGAQSYWNQFYALQYSLLIALPMALWLLVRHRAQARQGWRWLAQAERVPIVYYGVFALGSFLAVHTMHMKSAIVAEWIFAARAAIGCAFIFFFALMFLLTRPTFPWKAAGVFLLAGSSLLGLSALRAYVLPIEGKKPPRPSALATFLVKERQKRGHFSVVYRQPQVIVADAPGVGFFWHSRVISLADVVRMVTRLGADLVIAPTRGGEGFSRDRSFSRDFAPYATVGGLTVYEPRPALLARRHLLDARAGRGGGTRP